MYVKFIGNLFLQVFFIYEIEFMPIIFQIISIYKNIVSVNILRIPRTI